eukprot:Colp12_sorted_trinity150504_noHs@13961
MIELERIQQRQLAPSVPNILQQVVIEEKWTFVYATSSFIHVFVDHQLVVSSAHRVGCQKLCTNGWDQDIWLFQAPPVHLQSEKKRLTVLLSDGSLWCVPAFFVQVSNAARKRKRPSKSVPSTQAHDDVISSTPADTPSSIRISSHSPPARKIPKQYCLLPSSNALSFCRTFGSEGLDNSSQIRSSLAQTLKSIDTQDTGPPRGNITETFRIFGVSDVIAGLQNLTLYFSFDLLSRLLGTRDRSEISKHLLKVVSPLGARTDQSTRVVSQVAMHGARASYTVIGWQDTTTGESLVEVQLSGHACVVTSLRAAMTGRLLRLGITKNLAVPDPADPVSNRNSASQNLQNSAILSGLPLELALKRGHITANYALALGHFEHMQRRLVKIEEAMVCVCDLRQKWMTVGSAYTARECVDAYARAVYEFVRAYEAIRGRCD